MQGVHRQHVHFHYFQCFSNKLALKIHGVGEKSQIEVLLQRDQDWTGNNSKVTDLIVFSIFFINIEYKMPNVNILNIINQIQQFHSFILYNNTPMQNSNLSLLITE